MQERETTGYVVADDETGEGHGSGYVSFVPAGPSEWSECSIDIERYETGADHYSVKITQESTQRSYAAEIFCGSRNSPTRAAELVAGQLCLAGMPVPSALAEMVAFVHSKLLPGGP